MSFTWIEKSIEKNTECNDGHKQIVLKRYIDGKAIPLINVLQLFHLFRVEIPLALYQIIGKDVVDIINVLLKQVWTSRRHKPELLPLDDRSRHEPAGHLFQDVFFRKIFQL